MSAPGPSVTFYDVPAAGRLGLVAFLAEAAWRKGRKMLILVADGAAAAALDEALWTFSDETFLPHEVVAPGAAPSDEQARVVITFGEADPIGADVLVQLEPASPAFAERFRAVIDVVDHRSDALLAASRARYAAWRDGGRTPVLKRR